MQDETRASSRGKKGRIFLDRNIFESDIFEDAELFRFFCYILGQAEYQTAYRHAKDRSGRRYSKILQRGQTWENERDLAERFGVTRKVIRGWLARLEKGDRYTLKKGPQGTVITICKFDEYQTLGDRKGPTTSSNRDLPNTECINPKQRIVECGTQSGPAVPAPIKGSASSHNIFYQTLSVEPESVYRRDASPSENYPPTQSQIAPEARRQNPKVDPAQTEIGEQVGIGSSKLPAVTRAELDKLYQRLPLKPGLWKPQIGWNQDKKGDREKTARGASPTTRDNRLFEGTIALQLDAFAAKHGYYNPATSDVLGAF